jgi:hypothetical protein
MTRGEAKAKRDKARAIDHACAMVRYYVADAFRHGAEADDVLHEVHDGMRDSGRLKDAEGFRRAMQAAQDARNKRRR